MKKNKYPQGLLVFASVLFAVLSCQEDEKLEARNEALSISDRFKQTGSVTFDGTEGDPIDFSIAKKWVANYKGKSGNPDEIVAHYFGFEIIKEILNQPNCVGIRIYYALDDIGEKKLILIGVDAKGQNMLPSTNGRTKDGNTAADFSLPCPSYCPDNGL